MRWFGLTLLCLLVAYTSAYPRERRQAELQENADLTPLSEDTANEDLSERDKRFLEAATQSKYSVKNALLGLIFGSTGNILGSSSTLSKTQNLNHSPKSRPRVKLTTTTEEIPVFDRDKVSLQFPGELFGSSLSLLLRSTKIVGSVIENSAQRYQTFLRLFKPLFRGQFEIKGLDPITTTTERPTTISQLRDYDSSSGESTTILNNLIR